MKKLVFIMLFTMFIAFTTLANATLWDRGGGMIYDDVLDITWLQDANYAKTSGYDADGLMTWDEAITWVSSLVYYDAVRDIYLTGWRLPTSPGTESSSGGTLTGEGEMGYLFTQYGISTSSPGPFVNLLGGTSQYGTGHWTGSQRAGYIGDIYGDHLVYYMGDGYEVATMNSTLEYAWAVRDGDVLDTRTVPEPATILLFGLGLIGLAGMRRRLERKK